MKTLRNYPNKILIGERDGQNIYLSAPKWDCGWYWGFGYIGNNNCHYHVDGLTKHNTYNEQKKVFEHESTNLYDGFIKHFGDTLRIRKSALWTICELFSTFYILKETAEVLGRGGAHYTTNPCAELIKNTDETKRINESILPAVFDKIYEILERNIEKEDAKIVRLILKGDTRKVVEYMNENKIKTDDLASIEGVSKHDENVIHSTYYKMRNEKMDAEKQK